MSADSDPDRLERLARYLMSGDCIPAEAAEAMEDAAERIRSNQAALAALRARVVVAEEALRVAHEDADRLAPLAERRRDYLRSSALMFNEHKGLLAEAESRLEAHRVAVESRPKAPQ